MLTTHPHPELIAAPDEWCTNCGTYRSAEDGRSGGLCPSCIDDRRHQHDVDRGDPWHPHNWHGRTCPTYRTLVVTDCECGGAQRAYDARQQHNEERGHDVSHAAIVGAVGPVAYQVVREHEDADGNRVIDEVRILGTGEHITVRLPQIEAVLADGQHWAYPPLGWAQPCGCPSPTSHAMPDAGVIDD